jgi:hypothetical protein
MLQLSFLNSLLGTNKAAPLETQVWVTVVLQNFLIIAIQCNKLWTVQRKRMHSQLNNNKKNQLYLTNSPRIVDALKVL